MRDSRASLVGNFHSGCQDALPTRGKRALAPRSVSVTIPPILQGKNSLDSLTTYGLWYLQRKREE